MKLTADTKPYQLRKELKLPREECRLLADIRISEAGVGKPGYSILASWKFTESPPEFSTVEYDPSGATLVWSPQPGMQFYFDFIASKVLGNPPQYLTIRCVTAGRPSVTVNLKRPKGSDEIPTIDIEQTLDQLRTNAQFALAA